MTAWSCRFFASKGRKYDVLRVLLFALSLVQKNLSVNAGGQADEAAEVIREMALVGKARPQRRLQRRDALSEEFFRLADADILEVAIRREPLFTAERTVGVWTC